MASAVINSLRTISGNQPAIRRIIEKAAGVFLMGVPVQIDAGTGAIKEWDGATVAQGIAGVSKEAASNLGTTGVAQTLTFGSVPNETLAVNIPRGAPINDGTTGFEQANADTVFYGQVGPSQTPVATDVGKQYGMTKDSDNHWFVDRTKSTVGTNTVVVIVKLDTLDVARGVHFQFVQAAWQLAQ